MTKAQSKRQKIELKIDVVKKKIMEKTEKYRLTNEERNQDNIKYAYIVFRSMEGMARAVNAY